MLCLSMIAPQVSKVDPGTPQEDAKKALIEKIDTYIQVWQKSSFGGSLCASKLDAVMLMGCLLGFRAQHLKAHLLLCSSLTVPAHHRVMHK